MEKFFTHNDYEILKREILYQGIYRLVRYTVRHKLFNGGWSKSFTREILERDPAAAILPYDPVLDNVVLIEEFRMGSLAQPSSPWLLETVAGVIEPGEQPHEVAIREAKEEAGCDITDLETVSDYFVTPGCSNEYLYIYCGKVDASHVGGIHGLQEEHEDIRVWNIPVEEAFARLRNNEIKNVPLIVSLQWLDLNRVWLRKKWGC